MSTPMTRTADPVDHDHGNLDLSMTRNAPTLDHLRSRDAGGHGKFWLPGIDQSERRQLHARLHAEAAAAESKVTLDGKATLRTELDEDAVLGIIRALAQFPFIGDLRLHEPVTPAKIAAELNRIGEILRQHGERHTQLETDYHRLVGERAAVRRFLGVEEVR